MQWTLVGRGCRRKNLQQSLPSQANQSVVTYFIAGSGDAVDAGGSGMSEKEFTAEYAKSGKSQCRKCEGFIAKVLRVKKRILKINLLAHFHSNCCCVERLMGIITLADQDHAAEARETDYHLRSQNASIGTFKSGTV